MNKTPPLPLCGRLFFFFLSLASTGVRLTWFTCINVITQPASDTKQGAEQHTHISDRESKFKGEEVQKTVSCAKDARWFMKPLLSNSWRGSRSVHPSSRSVKRAEAQLTEDVKGEPRHGQIPCSVALRSVGTVGHNRRCCSDGNNLFFPLDRCTGESV